MLHISPGITIYILTITFILGCCLGSFADCAAGRLLSGESVVAGRSHCDHCGHVLGVLDLIPLFSWLLLKGHCRYCRAKIPAEAFFVELVSGIACCMIVYRYDMSVMSLRGILLTVVLMILSLTDLHGWIIPDRLQIAGCVIFLATALFLPDPIQRIFGGLFLGLILGGGDIKLFFMTGLYLSSAWEILFYLILSCLFGLGFASFRKEKRVPFGPAIAAACFIMILYGEKLTGWYTGLF